MLDEKKEEEFNTRLNLLYNSGQINERILNFTKKLIGWLQEQHILIDSEKGNMLVVHLALALQRLEKKEAFEEGDIKTLKKELASHPQELELAQRMAEMTKQELDISIPEIEIYFIAVHICNAKNLIELLLLVFWLIYLN